MAARSRRQGRRTRRSAEIWPPPAACSATPSKARERRSRWRRRRTLRGRSEWSRRFLEPGCAQRGSRILPKEIIDNRRNQPPNMKFLVGLSSIDDCPLFGGPIPCRRFQHRTGRPSSTRERPCSRRRLRGGVGPLERVRNAVPRRPPTCRRTPRGRDARGTPAFRSHVRARRETHDSIRRPASVRSPARWSPNTAGLHGRSRPGDYRRCGRRAGIQVNHPSSPRRRIRRVRPAHRWPCSNRTLEAMAEAAASRSNRQIPQFPA